MGWGSWVACGWAHRLVCSGSGGCGSAFGARVSGGKVCSGYTGAEEWLRKKGIRSERETSASEAEMESEAEEPSEAEKETEEPPAEAEGEEEDDNLIQQSSTVSAYSDCDLEFIDEELQSIEAAFESAASSSSSSSKSVADCDGDRWRTRRRLPDWLKIPICLQFA
ncbi:hypothetical protein LXL04_002330 [Taraxacum kok-saghyz]